MSGTYKNRTYTGIRTLDITATLDEASKQLVVHVVNRSKNDAIESMIDLVTGGFTGDILVSIVNGLNLKAENTIEKPYQIGIKASNIKSSGKSLTYTFEPHSITALVCNIG